MDVKDKIAIVTGGTGALGRVIALKLAEKGIKVYVPSRKIENFSAVFDDSANADAEDAKFTLKKIYCLQCDAQLEKDVTGFIEDVVKQEGRIDYLINTVGGYHPRTEISEMGSKLLLDMINLNFITTFLFTASTVKVMLQNNYGRIISVSARAALETTPGKFAYSLSKSSVIKLMEGVALETMDADITANTIVPFMIDTPANRSSSPDANYSKWTSPKDIAETILFLLSDPAKAISGSTIRM